MYSSIHGTNGIDTGIRARTCQTYNEANSKNGLQFYTILNWPKSDQIPSGQSRTIVFRTTSKKVIAKIRAVHYEGEEFSLEILKDFNIDTPGLVRTPGNYNGVNPVATSIELQKNAVISGGTPIDDEPEYYFGSSVNVLRDGQSIPEGSERVLPGDEYFAVRITNTGNMSGRFKYHLVWYEGEPDLPLRV